MFMQQTANCCAEQTITKKGRADNQAHTKTEQRKSCAEQ